LGYFSWNGWYIVVVWVPDDLYSSSTKPERVVLLLIVVVVVLSNTVAFCSFLELIIGSLWSLFQWW
jgi:hypothetical protein